MHVLPVQHYRSCGAALSLRRLEVSCEMISWECTRLRGACCVVFPWQLCCFCSNLLFLDAFACTPPFLRFCISTSCFVSDALRRMRFATPRYPLPRHFAICECRCFSFREWVILSGSLGSGVGPAGASSDHICRPSPPHRLFPRAPRHTAPQPGRQTASLSQFIRSPAKEKGAAPCRLQRCMPTSLACAIPLVYAVPLV